MSFDSIYRYINIYLREVWFYKKKINCMHYVISLNGFVFDKQDTILRQIKLLHTLLNNNISVWVKLKADNKFNVAELMISICDWIETIVGKRKNTGYQHFLLFL